MAKTPSRPANPRSGTRRARQEAERRAAQRKRIVLIVAAVAAVVAVGIAALSLGSSDTADTTDTTAAVSEAVTLVSAQEATELIASHTGDDTFAVVDVRSPEEFASGHLEGAVNLNVEDPAFADLIGELDPAGTYLVYCHSGNRSAVATAQLRDAGFEHVFELDGGITSWSGAGLPLV